MGSLTDFFGYLKATPETLTDTKKMLSHITPTREMKKARRELKLYKEETEGICFTTDK